MTHSKSRGRARTAILEQSCQGSSIQVPLMCRIRVRADRWRVVGSILACASFAVAIAGLVTGTTPRERESGELRTIPAARARIGSAKGGADPMVVDGGRRAETASRAVQRAALPLPGGASDEASPGSPDPAGIPDAAAVAAARYEALYARATAFPTDGVGREELVETARDAAAPAELRGIALWGLARAGEVAAAESIALEAGSPADLRRTALDLLCRHGGRAAWDTLLAVLRTAYEDEVRAAALGAAALIDSQAAIPVLAEHLRADAPPALRRAARAHLERVGTPGALAALCDPGALAATNSDDALAHARAIFNAGGHDPARSVVALERLAAVPCLPEDARRELTTLAERARRAAAPVSDQANRVPDAAEIH